MTDLTKVPWSLWIYSAVVLVSMISVIATTDGPVSARLLFAIIMFAWLYFLLKGIRLIWIVTIGIYVIGLAPDIISGVLEWWAIVLSVIGLILLLLPVTRRYFSRDAVAV